MLCINIRDATKECFTTVMCGLFFFLNGLSIFDLDVYRLSESLVFSVYISVQVSFYNRSSYHLKKKDNRISLIL